MRSENKRDMKCKDSHSHSSVEACFCCVYLMLVRYWISFLHHHLNLRISKKKPRKLSLHSSVNHSFKDNFFNIPRISSLQQHRTHLNLSSCTQGGRRWCRLKAISISKECIFHPLQFSSIFSYFLLLQLICILSALEFFHFLTHACI